MGLTLLAAPASEPVTLADLKAHLRIDGDHEDTVLTTLGVVARATVERLSGRALIAQTWRWTFDRLPTGGCVVLPIAPVIAVPSVRVAAADGTMVTVPGADMVLDLVGEPARLAFKGVPPHPGVPIAGIEVEILAGYGPDADAVPAQLVHAVRLLTAHWYAMRGDAAASTVPEDVAALIAGHRRPRLVA